MEDCRGFSGEQDTKKSKQKKRSNNITSDQQFRLEEFFERCPHPDETQRHQIAKDLGLELEQIKHWFQKKKTKMSQPAESQGSTLEETCVLNRECNNCDIDEAFVPSHSKMEKERMSKVAKAAIKELHRLVRMNRPLWDNSSNGGGYVLVREEYENMFPRIDSSNNPHTHEESSKHNKVVKIGARLLVDMLLDSEEWVNIFPTIVSKAETVKVLDIGSLDDRSGALQVVYEEMNAPIVSSRELFFLRYCEQIEVGAWAIAHVSIDSFEERVPNLCARRLPSGCIICRLPNETSMVTWVEHMVVSDRMEESLERGLINHNIAYGAKRWLWALHRMCERFACTSIDNMPLLSSEQVMNLFIAKRRATRFSDRMVRDFCEVVHKVRNKGIRIPNSKMRINFRKNEIPRSKEGTLGTVITTISLPIPPENLFRFLMDASKRSQWDYHCYGRPADKIAHFEIGGNHISIFKMFNKKKSNAMVFQDSYTDPLGSYIVYAPMTVKNMHVTIKREDLMVPILPSGFFISEDSTVVAEASNRQHANNKSRGSLLTMAYQLFMADKSSTIKVLKETMIKNVCATIEKIKAAF